LDAKHRTVPTVFFRGGGASFGSVLADAVRTCYPGGRGRKYPGTRDGRGQAIESWNSQHENSQALDLKWSDILAIQLSVDTRTA
jgi:hypothetical protein